MNFMDITYFLATESQKSDEHSNRIDDMKSRRIVNNTAS